MLLLARFARAARFAFMLALVFLPVPVVQLFHAIQRAGRKNQVAKLNRQD